MSAKKTDVMSVRFSSEGKGKVMRLAATLRLSASEFSRRAILDAVDKTSDEQTTEDKKRQSNH